jgi:hypothetical protein
VTALDPSYKCLSVCGREIYYLGDAIEAGVWTSYHHFWDGKGM